MARTQQQRRAETRTRLLMAAAELFADQGYDAVSIDAIGDRADRTSGAVYDHFGGKEGVLLALLEGFQSDLAAVVEAEFATQPDLAGRLLALWRNVASHPGADGANWFLLEVELWLHAARDPDRAAPLSDRYRAIHHLMRDEFSAWIEEFDLDPPLPTAELPAAVMASLMGLEMQRRLVPEAVTDASALATLLALFGAPALS